MTGPERRARFMAELARQMAARAASIEVGVAAVLGTLAELQQTLRDMLARQRPEEFTADRLPVMIAEVDRQVGRWIRAAGQAAGEAIEAAWEIGPRLVEEPIRAAGISIGWPRIPDSLLDELKDYTADRIGGLRPAARSRVENHVRLLVLGGQSPYQAMIGVGADVNQGPLRVVSLRAETIVRTESGRVHSQAGQRRMEDAAAHVEGLQKRWRRGKSRSSHAAIHNQTREIAAKYELPNGVQLMYPRETGAPVEEVANCACQSVPFKASWT